MKIARGSSFAYSGRRNVSYELLPGKDQRLVGFRLVHEGGNRQRVYGWQSKQSSPPSLAIAASSSNTDHVVGFRLVCEET